LRFVFLGWRWGRWGRWGRRSTAACIAATYHTSILIHRKFIAIHIGLHRLSTGSRVLLFISAVLLRSQNSFALFSYDEFVLPIVK
jgi:hypothetical protein